MKYLLIGFALLIPCKSWGVDPVSGRAEEIVRRSVANTNADWAVAPRYDFTKRDIVTHGGQRSTKTYQVTMIAGSPYNKLVAINGQPLSPAQAALEDRKAADETNRRRSESPSARQKRVAEYQKERHQDHELMAEMAKAFDFQLTGEDTISGRRCFVLDAKPKAGYRPPNRETKVLTGMRGTLWVDTQAYRWVKVHAEVFRPVAFGLFFARVQPGTEFSLEEKPVTESLWLPSHFSMAVNAKVLFLSRRSTDDETYFNYRPASGFSDNRTRSQIDAKTLR